jgi:4-amino-4-deoxy-L-arabinose transferase-like glycosyltransferase
MRFTIKNLYWIDFPILLLALIVTLFGIGNYGLYEPHEGHFAMVSQEMIWRGDWITPHLNGSPYLNKPPLLYWLIAISTSIFGTTEFAARLPIALVGWLGIVIAWKWTREMWGINPSRIAALMLSVTLGWFIFTHQLLIDVLLGTLLLSSNYFLWRSLYQPKSWFYWLGAYISLALCVLTKGLIGIIFPLAGCLTLVLIRQDWKVIKRIRLYKGLLLVLAIVLPWFIAVEQANPGFIHYFIFNEHFDRLLDRRFPPDYEVSKVSAVGYLAMTACWCFPWVLFLPSVVKSTWREWQLGLKAQASILERKNSDGILLVAIAGILPVVFFLPFSSRLIYYSVPAIPPYIILCAGWWHQNNKNSSRSSVGAKVGSFLYSHQSSVDVNGEALAVVRHCDATSSSTETAKTGVAYLGEPVLKTGNPSQGTGVGLPSASGGFPPEQMPKGFVDISKLRKDPASPSGAYGERFPMSNPKGSSPSYSHQSSVGTICQSPVELTNCRAKTKTVNIYGLIAVCLGICFCSVIVFLPLVVELLPPIINTPEIKQLIVIVAIALGLGWIITGIGMLRRFPLAWLPLFLVLTITYVATVQGFVVYQDVRSSKNLVQQANSYLSVDTLWVFEGSREIGAAGAIIYYLNQDQSYSETDIGNYSTAGWTKGKNSIYRTMMILADGGKNRIPPQFPGSLPQYLITQAELQNYWNSDRSVVFMTDFMRQPNDKNDPIGLNLPQGATEPFLISGQRRLYLNKSALNQLATSN